MPKVAFSDKLQLFLAFPSNKWNFNEHKLDKSKKIGVTISGTNLTNTEMFTLFCIS